MAVHRILIVDDEPKVAFFFQKYLEMVQDGYITKAVNSGEEALQELKKQAYDLIITDLRMPKMDGLELLRQARIRSPATKTILITAYGTQDIWQEANRLAVFRSLSKPLKISELLTCVRQALHATNESSGLLILTGAEIELLTTRLEILRVDVGARTLVLADTAGHILVSTGSVAGLELSSTIALLGGTMAASSELAIRLSGDQPVHLSYYEGPPYDLYAINVGHKFFLTMLYDRRKEASRIGLVWLYTRRVLAELHALLSQERQGVPGATVEQGFAESLQEELENLFDNNGASDRA